MKSVLKNQSGFTLIELAIVLVIIGIILGAALKGPDLIRSARTKKFVNDIKKWEIAAWTHFDRRGSFPGDANRDGIIGKEHGSLPRKDLDSLNLTQPPASPLTFGSYQFYVFLGSEAYKTTSADATQQNLLVICAEPECTTAFTDDEISFVEAFDTAIDGFADGNAGLVRGVSVEKAYSDNKSSLAFFVNDLTGFPWAADKTKALVYYFDRPPNTPVKDSK